MASAAFHLGMEQGPPGVLDCASVPGVWPSFRGADFRVEMVSFTDLKWTELPERKGMQFAVLSGDPKKGEYTQMRKVPAGTDNGLHSHSSELKNVIISGVWYTGTDAASATDFGPGSIVMMPASPVEQCSLESGVPGISIMTEFGTCEPAGVRMAPRSAPRVNSGLLKAKTHRNPLTLLDRDAEHPSR